MSFILDALRKSESERRLETMPEIMRVPLSIEKQRLPLWAGALIAVLAIGFVAVLFVWLTDRPDPVGSASMPLRGAPQIAEPPAQLPVAAPAAIEPPVADAATSEAQTPDVVAAESASAAASGTAASQASAQPQPATSALEVPEAEAPGVDSSLSLPSIAELVAEGIAIPPLDLQLHVNSDDPANRFVLINGSRYTAGDRLSEGPDLVAITAEGAVLRYARRDFLLTTK